MVWCEGSSFLLKTTFWMNQRPNLNQMPVLYTWIDIMKPKICPWMLFWIGHSFLVDCQSINSWIFQEFPTINDLDFFNIVTKSTSSYLRKGKTEQTCGDPLAIVTFLVLSTFSAYEKKKIYPRLFLSWITLKTWTDTVKKNRVSQFDYTSYEGSLVISSVCFLSHC